MIVENQVNDVPFKWQTSHRACFLKISHMTRSDRKIVQCVSLSLFINIHVTGDTVPSDSGHTPYYKPHHSGALRIVDRVTQFLTASLPDASCRSLYSLCKGQEMLTALQ